MIRPNPAPHETASAQTAGPPIHRRPWFAVAVGSALQFASWCIVDVLYVRFEMHHVEPAILIAPIVALVLQILLPAYPTRRRRIVAGVLLSLTSTAIAVVLVILFGLPFHFAIGGRF